MNTLLFSVGTFGISAVHDLEFMQKYMNSVIEMLHIGFTRLIKFWLQSDLIYKLVGLKRKEDKIVETLHAMSNSVSMKNIK